MQHATALKAPTDWDRYSMKVTDVHLPCKLAAKMHHNTAHSRMIGAHFGPCIVCKSVNNRSVPHWNGCWVCRAVQDSRLHASWWQASSCAWWERPTITWARAWRVERWSLCRHQAPNSRLRKQAWWATHASTEPQAAAFSSMAEQVHTGSFPSHVLFL